jgi:hypothetical protein
MSSTKYTAYTGFDNNNAYKFINKALNTDLRDNYDDYICDGYEISMDGNMAVVKFNELNKKQIIETMNKIARALHMDENCFNVTDSNDEEIDVFESEEEKKEEIKEVKKNDCPLTRLGYTKYQVKFIKMMKDYINQMTAEKEKVNKVKVAISMFQFVMANIDLMYTDLLPSNKDKVNSMIKGLIDKAVEVKQQVFASQNLPSDVSSQAILVLDTAHKNMISVYNENK